MARWLPRPAPPQRCTALPLDSAAPCGKGGGHLEVVRFLLSKGADVNAHNEDGAGESPLGEVAATCSMELAAILVDAGANPTIPGWMGISALDRALKRVRGDGPEVCALLLSAAKTRFGYQG